MVKIRTLLPTLKEKKRYVLYEINSKNRMNNPEIFIKEELRGFIGDLGLARAGLKFIKRKNNKGILQVNNKSLNEIRAGLALIKDHNFRTLKVSGVINKLKDI